MNYPNVTVDTAWRDDNEVLVAILKFDANTAYTLEQTEEPTCDINITDVETFIEKWTRFANQLWTVGQNGFFYTSENLSATLEEIIADSAADIMATKGECL